MSREILDRLNAEWLVALKCKGSAWGGSIFAQSLIPDTWMGLVLRPDGGRRFVPAGEDPHPANQDTLMLVRNRAVTVPLSVDNAPAAGGHGVSGTVELLLRCLARDDEMAALHRALLNDDTLTLERLSEVLTQAGTDAALRSFVHAQPAETLVHGDPRDALLANLRDALQKFLFSAGLDLERLGRVSFTSGTLAEHEARERDTARRLHEVEARQRVAQAALAATHKRLDGLGEIMAKLRAAAAGDDSLQWRDLLPTLTPGERGRLLENLWRLTPNRTTARAVVAVVGNECVWLDPAQPGEIRRQVDLPDDLGGLRSVAFDGRGSLLVGAALGVWRVEAASGAVQTRYAVPDAAMPRTGFNASCVVGDRLYATHSQLGAWSWALDEPQDASALLTPAAGVPRTIRAVTPDARGRILFATDDRVRAFDADGGEVWQSAAADSSIHCVAPLEDTLYIGTAGGTLLRVGLERPAPWISVHRILGAVESLAARRWDDLVELVLPAAGDGVVGVYGEEGIVSRLLEAPVPVRRVWACDDTLVALSETRDRLIVLAGDCPERTGREALLARALGRPIQDACLVSEPSDVATRRQSDEG